MNETLHKALSVAVMKILRPLVGVVLRHGMAYGTFAELARKVYVDKAFEQMAEAGERPSDSGVSALTGLTRKETKRLREQDELDDEASSQRYNRAIRVISGWTSDADYLDAKGSPRVLPLEGEQGSFASLVRQYSGDIPSVAMLKVLESGETVEVTAAGVRLLARAYVPVATPLDKVSILGSDVAELIATIAHNLQDGEDNPYFQRKVSNVLVHPDAVAAFQEWSNARSQALLEEYHEFLSAHEIDPDADTDVEPRYIAVGIYFSDYRPGSEES
ncbi:MAG: hypothetical protein HKN19_01550 [Halioglobus sp.]|nr:hypothetical protein [Halioglobus sp.]